MEDISTSIGAELVGLLAYLFSNAQDSCPSAKSRSEHQRFYPPQANAITVANCRLGTN